MSRYISLMGLKRFCLRACIFLGYVMYSLSMTGSVLFSSARSYSGNVMFWSSKIGVLAIIARIFLIKRYIVTCLQSPDSFMDERTILAYVLSGITRRTWWKSPNITNIIMPNRRSFSKMSGNFLLTASKLNLCIIGVLSHNISLYFCSILAMCVWRLILRTESKLCPLEFEFGVSRSAFL